VRTRRWRDATQNTWRTRARQSFRAVSSSSHRHRGRPSRSASGYLVLDEVSPTLTRGAGEEVAILTQSLVDEGVGVLEMVHDVRSALGATRVMVLKGGRVAWEEHRRTFSVVRGRSMSRVSTSTRVPGQSALPFVPGRAWKTVVTPVPLQPLLSPMVLTVTCWGCSVNGLRQTLRLPP